MMSNYSLTSNYTLYSVINRTINEGDENSGHFALSIIDSIIVVVYIIGSVSLGVYVGRKHKTAEDYFLAGRSMTWPFVGLSLFATNVSSSALVGLAGSAYKNGIAVYNYNWTAAVTLILFATFFLPSLLKSKIHTLPEMLELRYNSILRYYYSFLSIIVIIFISNGGSLYGGALVVKMAFPQLEIWHTVIILAVIAGGYTACGGLMAVIYTDTVQAITLTLGSAVISGFTLYEVGGWKSFKSQVPPEHLSIIRPIDDPTVPWTGLVFGISILEIYYWCTNQSIVQRTLSSKDYHHGRWGCAFSSIFNIGILFIMVLPGTMASVIFKDLPKPDSVLPKLMFNLLPVGVLGIVLSGFVAALLSDIDSHLNSASTLITMDFAKKLKPDLTEGQLMKVGRVVTVIIMIASASWAPFISNFDSVYQYIQTLQSYLTPPVVALYLVGYFWKGANARGALIMLIAGNIAGIILFVLNEVMKVVNLHFLHAAPILFFINVLILIVASLFSKHECSADQLKVMWSYQDFKEDLLSSKDLPFWKNYHLQALLVFILIAIVLGLFW